MRRIAYLLPLVLAWILPVGCQTDSVSPLHEVTYASKLSDEPVHVQTIAVPGIAEEDAIAAIRRAALNRGWEVDTLDNGDLRARLTHRNHQSTLTFKYVSEFVEVYSVSYRIDKATQIREERDEPEGWIRNLHKDVLELLGLLEA